MAENGSHVNVEGKVLSEAMVRDALLHLYDNAYLLHHSLLPILVTRHMPDPVARAQQLRSTVVDAIHSLAPAPPVLPRSREWRPYGVLLYRYVDRMPDDRIVRELAISERQLFRDLKDGVALLTAALQSRSGEPHPEGDAFASSLGEVGLRLERLSLPDLIQAVLPIAEALSASLGKQFHVMDGGAPATLVIADEPLSRQALISGISCCLQRSVAEVSLSPVERGGDFGVVLRYGQAREAGQAAGYASTELVEKLMERQGGQVAVAHGDGEGSLTLFWPGYREPSILIIDDDPAMVRLFSRYLSGHGYRVLGSVSGPRALELTHDCGAHLVILDVMMREVDGWATLQRLKADPATHDVPVLVCTVINEPQLAQALGASAFLRKPVAREQLLEAVAALLGI